MSLEQQVTALVEASNNLTGAVNGKIGEIDQRMDDAEADLEHWKATTSYVQEYLVANPEDENSGQTEKYHLIQLYRIRNKTQGKNPWVHFGYSGGNTVGSMSFLSLSQSHAGYTGQVALIAKRGNGDVKFFVDRSNENNAPVYVAIKNLYYKSAFITYQIASYMVLDVVSLGAQDLAEWQAANSSIEEITQIDISSVA